jgi:release factor glutamine methyltransferase
MTRAGWLAQAEKRLMEAGVESARLDAELLLAASLGVSRATVRVHLEGPVPAAADHLLERRLTREPLAYILKKKEFYGRDFVVGPGVLVPRPETEGLVDCALRSLAGQENANVLDFGTGSGCIAITIALEFPRATVTGVDISAGALAYAHQNGQALGAGVEWIEADGFPAGQTFDLVVSNPPYIVDALELQPEVGLFEPRTALFGGPDGLDFYRLIARDGAQVVRPGGGLILEIGFDQESTVPNILESEGWLDCRVHKDLAGLPRVVQATRP